MEVDSHFVKMEDLREYAELLRQANDEGAKRMVTRVEGILEATDDAGRSTPHFAALGGCLPFLQLSISQDKTAADRADMVDVNHRNENRQTALHYACSKNHSEITHLLLDAGANVNASDKYAPHHFIEQLARVMKGYIVNMLLAQPKINIDAMDSEGNTPLFLACEEGRENAAIALARKGADPLLKNKEEKCAFDVVLTSELRMKVSNAAEHARASHY